MQSEPRLVRRCIGGRPVRPTLVFVLLAACSDPRSGAVEHDSDASVRADSAAARDAADRDASSLLDSFSVEVRAATVELCAGDCTDLTVALHGANGTASYAWDQGLSPDASQHVCPTATTRYIVSVTDESGVGEFHQTQSASDGLTVSVKDCANEAQPRVLCEWRQRFELPTSGSLFRSDQPWLYLSANSAPRVDSAPDGSIYLSASFGKRIDLGAGGLTSQAQMSALVHKLDASCQPGWTRAIAPTNASDISMAQAIAVDPSGNAYVALIGGPLLDFDPLLASALAFATELVIQKFSPTGDVIYRSRFPLGPGVFLNDMKVDELGQVALVMLVSSVSDFGSGPLGLSPTTFQNVVLMLDAQGQRRGLQPTTSATHLELAGDQILLPLGGATQVDVATLLLGLSFLDDSNQNWSLESLARTDFDVSWNKPFQQEYLRGLAGLSAGGAAMLIGTSSSESSPAGDVYHDLTSLVRVDSMGQVVSTKPWIDEVSVDTGPAPASDGGLPTIVAPENELSIQRLDADVMGGLQLAGIYFGQVMLGNLKLSDSTAVVANEDYGAAFERAAPFVGKADTADTLLWLQRLEWGYDVALAGLGSDDAGNVTIGGQARVAPSASAAQGDSYELDVIVNRLRAH